MNTSVNERKKKREEKKDTHHLPTITCGYVQINRGFVRGLPKQFPCFVLAMNNVRSSSPALYLPPIVETEVGNKQLALK